MKLFGSILLVLAVLFVQVGTVAAAPQTQDATLTGTIQTITTETDASGVTTVVVTFEDGQTVSISVDAAVTLGLVTLDPTTNEPVVDETKFGTEVTIPNEEPDVHPIAELLGDFFDVDPSVIDSFHTGDNEAEQVFGFGVIAQALWMATDSEGETPTTDLELASAILEAKKSGDYKDVAALLGWEDGDEIPTNWGQFKKVLKDKHENLGAAHHADDDDAANDQNNGNGKNNENKKPKKPKGNGKP